MAQRRVRPKRPGRPPRRPIPGQAVRLRRGPKPPDEAVRILAAALQAEGHTDAAPNLGSRWFSAARRAWESLAASARRGVNAAVGPATRERLANVARPAIGGWVADITAAVRRALGLGHDAVQTIANWVFAEHTAHIRALATGAGIFRYVWTTRKDGNVRSLHRLLEGTIHTWNNPPVSGTNGWRGHPGEPAGPCRCVPWPIDLTFLVAPRRAA